MPPGNTVRVVVEEAVRLGRALRGGLPAVLALEEGDPQLAAVARVVESHGAGPAAVTAALTALASYRLAMRGEDWWRCYAEYHSARPPPRDPGEAARLVQGFLNSCPGAAIQREAKARRVARAAEGARAALSRLMKEPHAILESSRWLTEALARALRQEPWRKTIAFAVKMAYYAVRAEAGRVPGPGDAVIPVDVRVSCLTYSSMIVDAPGYRVLLREPEKVIEAWGIVSHESRVPMIHLDSLAWLAGWAPRDLPLGEAREAIRRLLDPHMPGRAETLAALLARRPCRG